MGQDSSKAGGSFLFLPENVVEILPYRARRSAQKQHSIFYLNEAGRWTTLLQGFNFLQVEDIRTEAGLKSKLLACSPDLILMESTLPWSDPIETVKQLDYLLEVPIVMICPRRSKDSSLIKRAYAAGICDTLFAPLRHDELAETLNVLLKFQLQVLGNNQ